MARVDSFYDLLEISANASAEEIEASYQRIMGFLGPDSMAMYAMLDEGEAERLREQIDEAYHTLTDPERRAAYDRSREHAGGYPNLIVPQQSTGDPNLSVGLVRHEPAPVRDEISRRDEARRDEPHRDEAWAQPRPEDAPTPAALPPRRDHSRDARGRAANEALSSAAALQALEEQAEGAAMVPPAPSVVSSRSVAPADGKRRRRLQPRAVFEVGPDTEFSGSLLRRLRESADATLEDVAEITKISKRYLAALEENDFDTLPAFVYVRGFVSEYARVLGLDSKLVANSYMALYQRYRGESG